MKGKLLIIPIVASIAFAAVGYGACAVDGHTHDWGEWQITTPATCTDKGVETRICKLDDAHKETREIPKNPDAHSYGEWRTDVAATCLQRNGKDVRECNLCHNKIYRDTTYTGGHVIEDSECKICHTPCTDGLEFKEITDGDKTVAYSLSGIGSAASANEILVPGKYGNLPVTKIESLAIMNSNARKIYLPDSVTTVNAMALRYNEQLEEAYIGNGVNEFPDIAFRDCPALKTIVAGDNNQTFATENGILYNKAKTEIIAVPEGLTEAILPDSLTVIGERKFADHYTHIQSVTFGANVTEIGDGAFGGSNLTTVTIPETVTSIGRAAFADCKNLKTVIWNAEACAQTDDELFMGSSALETIKIGKNVKSFAMNTFNWNGVSKQEIKVDIEDLTAWCKIDFTDYRQNPLYFLHNLYINGEPATEIVIPAEITSLDYTFTDCYTIEKVSFEAGSALVSLGDWSFFNCTGLTEITFPASLERIHKEAFGKCSALTKVTFENAEGWQMSKSEDMSEEPYAWESGTLDDPETNAAYLKGYSGSNGYFWKRGF